MPDEHNAFDLSKLLDSANNADIISRNQETRLNKVDSTGRPWPKDVRVQLNSGITVKCDVRYDGVDPDGQRRFLVIAEIDWENYHPTTLWVGEYPMDATLIFRIPGMDDDDAARMAAFMELRPEKILEVS